MLKIGIIGFGKMGMLHGALFEGTRKAKIVAICDKSFVMRFGFKKVYKNVHTYKNIDKMLDKHQFDVIVIATPTFNHKEAAIKALKKGCAVFLEKPLSISTQEGEEILKASTTAKKPVQVGFCNRFAMPISLAKEKIFSGVIGKINKVESKMYIGDVFEPQTGWRYKKEASGGGALMDFGIHMIDLLIWYFGEVENVKATSKKLYSVEVEDELCSDIKFKNGIKCYFETSWSKEEYRKSYTNLKVFGTKGIMEITDQTLDVYDKSSNLLESFTYPQLYNGSFIDVGGLLFSHQIEEFMKYLETGKTVGCTAEQAIYTQKVVESMYESAKINQTVCVEEC